MEDGSARWLAAVLVVGVVLVRGPLLAGLIPPFHGPDEPTHFNYVQRLGEGGTLPVLDIYCTPHSAEAHALIRDVLRLPERPQSLGGLLIHPATYLTRPHEGQPIVQPISEWGWSRSISKARGYFDSAVGAGTFDWVLGFNAVLTGALAAFAFWLAWWRP